MAKNTGKFASVFRVLDEGGKVKGVRAYITDDITLQKGQTVFFNDFESELRELPEKFENVTTEEINERIARTRENDQKYNRETVYSLRAGNIPEKKSESL